MSDVLSDDASDISGGDDSQEDVMTPSELIAKLEEVTTAIFSQKVICIILHFTDTDLFS